MYLDLSELPEVFDPYAMWSARRPALAWFRRDDHLGDSSQPLDESVRNEIERQTGLRPDGPIRLLTNLRYFGYVMNPVSYFYCFDKVTNRLQTVMAEVHNTPWGERHCYVLSSPVNPESGSVRTLWNDKEFHVSPFMDMNMRYRWQMTEPGERLAIHIETHVVSGNDKSAGTVEPRSASDRLSGTHQPFDVTLSLHREELSARTLRRALIRHPCMTASVTAGIYWQALKLWWKKVPYVPHPEKQPPVHHPSGVAGAS